MRCHPSLLPSTSVVRCRAPRQTSAAADPVADAKPPPGIPAADAGPGRLRWLAIAAVLVAVGAAHLWLAQIVFRAATPAPSPELSCISYDPRYRFTILDAEDLKEGVDVPEEWITEDLFLVSRVAKCIRIYSVTDGMEKVPEIASRLSLDVMVGLDITTDQKKNRQSIETAVVMDRTLKNIKYFIVGNEVLYHNMMKDHEFVDEAELYRSITDLRQRVTVPVSTAEPLPTWVAVPDLAEKLDFIALNNSPYWAGIPVEESTEYLQSTVQQLQWLHPEKPVFLSEVGWPAGGPTRGDAVPGRDEADLFFSLFTEWARKQKIAYNYFEAFDQPWKRTQLEGRVGSQWGLFDSSGRYKPGPLGGTATEVRKGTFPWALFSTGVGTLTCLALLLRRRWIRLGGAIYLISFAQTLTFIVVLAAHGAEKEYFLHSESFWIFVAAPLLALVSIVLVKLLETTETLSHDALFADGHEARSRRPIGSVDSADEATMPFVSIHVPCSSEPPAMVIKTLEALLALDHPRFEIIVVDNNTRDPSLYLPVAAFCAEHSSKIRFFHEDVLAGFKAGALNYALDRTSAEATLIAVVDSDYVVDPAWLREMTPLFADPSVAVVQNPQAYREWEKSPFSTMIRSEYEGFFQMAMVQRAARNAIIQHGTMLLLRKSVVEKVGRWAEWCITEDTELGLRILLAGWNAVYVPQVYGRGLLPQNSGAYFKQRFRWVAGGMTILRRYAAEFAGLRGRLGRAQRYQFVAGWLPWLADSVVPVFTLMAIVGVLFCLRNYLFFPPIEFAWPFVFYMFFQLTTGLVSYRARVPIGWFNSLLASLAGMSLTWVIAAATVRGLVQKKLVFVRTEKSIGGGRSNPPSWPWAIVSEGGSVALCCLLFCAGAALLIKYGWKSAEAVVWAFAIWLFILPPACSAILHALSREQNRRVNPS